MSVQDLLIKVDKIIAMEFKLELRKQGHYNTGKLDDSIEGQVRKDRLEGYANFYAAILNQGYGKEKASMKQWGFLKDYFLTKGLTEKEAGGAAAATIKKWQQYGMPTPNSYAYSQTGKRKDFIQIVIDTLNKVIDPIISTGIDKIISSKFAETKNETI